MNARPQNDTDRQTAEVDFIQDMQNNFESQNEAIANFIIICKLNDNNVSPVCY